MKSPRGRMKLNRYRTNSRKSGKKIRLILVFEFALISVLVIILLFSLNPFQSTNPLASIATIGENVVGAWQYDGENAQGNLVFYNGYEPVTIPADSKTFAADGEFVVIESHTPNSITYESTLEAELFNPLSVTSIILILLLIMTLPFILVRLSHRVGRKKGKGSKRFVAHSRRRA